MTEQQRDPIEYLINAMEWAGMEANPAKHGYGEKRRAVFAAIVELRKERDAALAERSEQLMEMNCAVLERDAVLQRAEELAHELRQTAQASQHVEQRAEQAEADVRLLLAESRGVSHALMVQPCEPMPLSDEAIAYSRGYSAAKAHIDIIVREIEGRFGRLDLRCQQAEAALATSQRERERLGRIYNAFTDEIREAVHGEWGQGRTHDQYVEEVKRLKSQASLVHDEYVQGMNRITDLEAALAQARAELLQRNGELVEAVSDREKWEEEAQRWQRETGYWAARGREREAVAQSPALPPLPEGWVREGVRDIILYRSHDRYTGVDGHVPPGGQVSVHAEGLRVSTTHVPVADLLIVLRHAEAAHLTLKEGK